MINSEVPDSLEYGVAAMRFPDEEEFGWVYPASCGFLRLPEPWWAASRIPMGALLYITGGGGRAEEEGHSYSYAAGQALASPDASRLTLRPDGETRLLCLLLQNSGALLEGISGAAHSDSGVGLGLARLYQDSRDGLLSDIFTASARVYALIMELRQCAAAGRAAYSETVRGAMAIIREEYAYLSGLDELAQRLEVSKSHLVRRFSAETGAGPGRYLQRVRLERARLLLVSRQYSVELVAQMTGYSCSNYFCKVFRKEFGLSPERYRERRMSTPGAIETSPELREMDSVMVL